MNANTMRRLLRLLEDAPLTAPPAAPAAAVPPPPPGLAGTLDVHGLAMALAVQDVGHFSSAMEKVQTGQIDRLDASEKAQLVLGFVNLLRSNLAGKYAILHKISSVAAAV